MNITTGHNSGEVEGGQLRSFIERIERVQSEIDDLNSDKSEIFKEIKGSGYDIKTIRKIVAMCRVDTEKRREEEAILDLYLAALGMLADTPLGQFAVTTSGVMRGGCA